MNFKPIIENSMIHYAGAVIQSRALVDARDCLKPSARQIFFSMKKNKLTHDKPFKKTNNAIGLAMVDFYIHGDSSCEGIIMRAGQSFAMRYPLIEVDGNQGTLLESGSWASPRYSSTRLSELASYLFRDIEKETIEVWYDNYENTQQYPSVLPSKGFFNLVNGTSGIGVGLASSCPQFNLRELNAALVHLLDNPNCSFDEIYCAPDFATGALLCNEEEIKESLKNGTGTTCRLRSIVDYDPKDRCFLVKEIPYGVYTNTICAQLEEILESEDNPGIERFNDLTGIAPLIKIYLTKKANPNLVLEFLYKKTSLQSFYGVNLTMLDKGKYPRVFGWKELLEEHLEHERIVYIRGYEFDLRKIRARLHIVEGLLKCLARIEEVITTIKSSQGRAQATSSLCENFLLDLPQAEAILNMRLSQLARLEIEKLENEKKSLENEAKKITSILENEDLLRIQIKKGLIDVAKKFGDNRRTRIISLDAENEINESKQVSIALTNLGAIFLTETTTLTAQKRRGVGSKFKLEPNEFIVHNLIAETNDTILFFTNTGKFYPFKVSNFLLGEKQYFSNLTQLDPKEKFITATLISKGARKEHLIFLTKNGILKKSRLSDYNLKRQGGALALKLDENDSIVSVLFLDNEKIGIASKNGQFIIIPTDTINAIGRVARGVIGMKLEKDDEVVSSKVLPDFTSEILSVSADGYAKRSLLSDFSTTARATKGVKLQKTTELCDFLFLADSSQDPHILVVSKASQIRLKLEEVPLLGRNTQGVQIIKLPHNLKIVTLHCF